MLFSFSALSLLEDADADISDTLPLSSSPITKLVTHSAATAFPDSGAFPRGGFFSSCGCRSVCACTKGTENTVTSFVADSRKKIQRLIGMRDELTSSECARARAHTHTHTPSLLAAAAAGATS
jgi:hypothetical protein